MLTEQQIKARMKGIGGSDIGAILGLNKWKTPLDVFMEKTGKVSATDLSGNDKVHFGNVLEDVVAREYERRHNRKVRKRNQMFVHRKFPWALANLDRTVDLTGTVLECKTADKWSKDNWGPDGTDQAPDSYVVQVVWYMGVVNYDLADLAVLIGGNDFRTYHFTRDRDLEEMCFRKGEEFWVNHVLKDIPPDPVCDQDLEALYAHDNGKSILATPAIEVEVARHKALKKEIERLEYECKEKELIIKSYIGDNAELLVSESGEKLATWKNDRDGKKFDVESFKKSMPNLYSEFCIEKPGVRRFLNKIK